MKTTTNLFFATLLLFTIFQQDLFPQGGQKLVPDSLAARDVFGYSVDLFENNAIVGAPQVSTSLSQAFGNGKVYVFQFNLQGWDQKQIITASDGSFWDWFGCSVAINNEYAAVGAFGKDITGADNGAVYIYAYNGNGWVEKQRITPQDSAPGDYFGWSVDLSNDKLVVGAPRKSDSLNEAGAVYVFRNNNGVWEEEEKLIPNDVFEWDQFGHSVSINNSQILIGKPQVSSSQLLAYGSGAAYYFTFDGNNWNQIYKLTPANIGYWDWFGCSVSIKNEQPFIGCFAMDITGWDNGTAYFFDEPNVYSQLIPNDTQPGDFFGWAVSAFKDNFVIGAPRSNEYGTRSGSVYLYVNNNNSFIQRTQIFDETPSSYEDFGHAVTLNNDFFIVGAPYSDDKGEESGSATIFNFNDVVPVELTSFTISMEGKSVLLEWETATEKNNRGFFVERNSNVDGKWKSLGFVEGNGTTLLPHKYSFKDYDLSVTGSYLYRLKQVDFDGSSTYTSTIEFSISNIVNKYNLLQNYPNPFNPETTISYYIPKKTFVTIQVSDSNGKIIGSLVNKEMAAGMHSVKFNGKNFSSGTYFYTIWAGDFKKTKKMILLK